MTTFRERESIDKFIYSEEELGKKYSGIFNTPADAPCEPVEGDEGTSKPPVGGGDEGIGGGDNEEPVEGGIVYYADKVVSDEIISYNMSQSQDALITNVVNDLEHTDTFEARNPTVIPDKIQNILRVQADGGCYLFWNKDDAVTSYRIYKDNALYEEVRKERFQTFVEGVNGTSMSLQVEGINVLDSPIGTIKSFVGEKSDAISTTPAVITSSSKVYNTKALNTFDFGPTSAELDSFFITHTSPWYVFSTRDDKGKTHVYFISTDVVTSRPSNEDFFTGNSFKVQGNILSKTGIYPLEGYSIPDNEVIVSVQFVPEVPFALVAAEMRVPFAEATEFTKGVKVKISSTEYDKFNIYVDNELKVENLRGIQPSSIINNIPVGNRLLRVDRVTSGGQITTILEEEIKVVEEALNDFELSTKDEFFTLSGSWEASELASHSGTRSLKSNKITGNKSTVQTISFRIEKRSKFSFWYYVNSEAGWDKFKGILDTELLFEISGTVLWSKFERVLAPGDYVLTLSYSKDGSGDSGFDAAFIDELLVKEEA